MRLPLANYYREPPEDLEPIPIVLVGRPNVGKSTLFNRLLSGTRRKKTPAPRAALISSRAGTTRDRKDAVAVFGGLLLRVIDTGGIESEKAVQQNTLLASIREHVWRAVAEASAIVFVIDAREGVTPVDLEIARMLRDGTADTYRDPFGPQRDKPVPIILVANKAEATFIGPYLNDCYELGVGDPVIISARQNEGMEDLYDRLCFEIGHLQEGEEEEDQEGSDGYEFADEDDQEEGEEESEGDMEEARGEGEAEAEEAEGGKPPIPTLHWMPPNPLSEEQKRSLRWFANHPADPLGQLDMGLKASVLHKEQSDMPKYWLNLPKSRLPNKDARDFVNEYKRLRNMDAPLRLAVVGLPNAGKSSLINALLQEERCIVDETNGTTMDAIVSDWTFKDRQVKLIDTCGINKGFHYPGDLGDSLEPGMGTRKAVRRAHVVVLCLDAHTRRKMTPYNCPSRFEVRLANWIVEEGKCMVIAVNKWDLVEEEEQPKLRDMIIKKVTDDLWQVKGVPVVFMSAKYNLNLAMMMTRCLSLYKRWNARLPTHRLNSWLQAWMVRWPPPWKNGQKINVKYLTQTRARPPTFVMWTNTTSGELPRYYLKQLQNAMREEFRISGVPMRFVLRSTIMPKPRKKLSKRDILMWKRIGPKQAEAVTNLNSKKYRRVRQTE